jgi:DNA-binding HxlR family transcriptional regulator
MKGYAQFCPVAVASEIFAQRWTPLILRELFAGSTHYNQIKRGLPLISKTLLAQRLRALADAGVVDYVDSIDGRAREYRLTPAGEEFRPVIQGLAEWGQRWTIRFHPHNLDAELLMWNVQRRLAIEQLPAERTLVRFDFDGLPVGYRRAHVFWLILDAREVDLCLKDPGDEVDLYVAADLRSFAQVWLGDLGFGEAVRNGRVRLTGNRQLVRAFPTWLLLSKFAGVARPKAGAIHAPAVANASARRAGTNALSAPRPYDRVPSASTNP